MSPFKIEHFASIKVRLLSLKGMASTKFRRKIKKKILKQRI